MKGWLATEQRALENETSTGQKLAGRLSRGAGASSLGKLTNQHPQETTTSFVSQQAVLARYKQLSSLDCQVKQLGTCDAVWLP